MKKEKEIETRNITQKQYDFILPLTKNHFPFSQVLYESSYANINSLVLTLLSKRCPRGVLSNLQEDVSQTSIQV